MWPFMLLGSFFAVAAATSQPRAPRRIPWISALVVLTLFVGLRHHVGMDWNNYLFMIQKASLAQTLDEYLQVAEPGYALLLVIGDVSGGGIYVTNLIGAAIFCGGLFAFARRCPEPWLALMTALPFFVVAYSMSANRQAVASGVLLFAIAHWENWDTKRKVGVILLAALFHSSAVIMLGFVGSALRMDWRAKALLVGIFGLIALYLLQATGRADYYDSAYGSGQTALTQSSGALIHVALNAVPASLYVLWPRRRAQLFPTMLLRHMAITAMLTFPLALVMSAAAGRISLYWYPVAIMVFSALPGAFAPNSRMLVRGLIAFLMLLEMIGWLLFANSSAAHMPYRNALFMPDYALHIGIVR